MRPARCSSSARAITLTERLGDLRRRDAEVLRAERQLAAHGGGRRAACADPGARYPTSRAEVAQPKLAASSGRRRERSRSARRDTHAGTRPLIARMQRALAAARRAGHQEHLAGLDAAGETSRSAGSVARRYRKVRSSTSIERAARPSVRRARCGRSRRGARPEPLGRGALVDADREAGEVGVLVQQRRADRHRRRRSPARESRWTVTADADRSGRRARAARAGLQGRPAAPPGGSCRRRRRTGRSCRAPPTRDWPRETRAGTRSPASIAGPTSAIGVPAARWAATGAKMSRPWNVCETDSSRQSARFSRTWAATMPPSRSAAGTSSPLSGPTKPVAARDLERDRHGARCRRRGRPPPGARRPAGTAATTRAGTRRPGCRTGDCRGSGR